MQVYRFMSEAEARKLQAGEVLENRTDHGRLRDEASNAFGFCFGIGNRQDALKAYRHLNGITSFEVLLVATTKPGVKLYPCKGRYVDYKVWSGQSEAAPHFIYIDELCTSRYKLGDFESFEFVYWPIEQKDFALGLIEDKNVQMLYQNYVPAHVYNEMLRYAQYVLNTQPFHI